MNTTPVQPDVPPRLTFRHWKPFAPDGFAAYVAVTERVSKKKVIDTTYAIREVFSAVGGMRFFHVFKEGEPEAREVRVYPTGYTCTCKSGTYRPGTECRHVLALQHLTTEGVL